ncbi:MAG TPA: hypothetical protein VFE51_23120 [Verrucomicrobiae bacterium]|nr:hypothetical protein [Verrucomicrobiae bacterium]
MSLLRLLTTGKTLIGLKKLDHRYQLPAQKAIPEFGSKKNPFRATVFPEKLEALDPEAEQPRPAGNSETPALDLPEPIGRGMALNPDEPRTEGSVRGESSPSPATLPQSEASPRRPSALRALLLWGRARKAGPAALSKGRPLIQAELSLDSVKVVRNDLSESDLEVIARDKGPAAQPAAPPEPDSKFDRGTHSPGMSRVCEANKL